MIYSDKIRSHLPDDPEGYGLCSVGVAILGSAVVGGAASMYGANKAASAQTDAANRAIASQDAKYYAMRNDLEPYMTAGTNALSTLQGRLPFLTSAVQPLDAAGLENLPGYQFTREQGLRAAQNALTATGLGRTGAAVKAATRFGTGLADQTYMGQANYVTNLELANRSNEYNRLMQLVGTGQNAAAGVGTAGVTTGQGIAGSQIGAGNAQAGAYMAGAGAIGNAANSLGSYAMLNQLTQNQGGMYGGGGQGPGWFPSQAWYNN